MVDPRDILTHPGYLEYVKHILNLKDALFFFADDDLELTNEEDELLYKFRELVDNDLGKYLPRYESKEERKYE